MAIWIWLGVTVFSLIVEFITFDMASIWFAFGGIIAMILAACGVGLTWQLIVFIVVALTLLLSLRKIALKYLQRGSNFKSNTEGLKKFHFYLKLRKILLEQQKLMVLYGMLFLKMIAKLLKVKMLKSLTFREIK